MAKDHSAKIIDFEAMKKWNSLPEDWRNMVLGNAYCSNCRVTTIVDYTVHSDTYGLILKGKCQTCDEEVTRVVED